MGHNQASRESVFVVIVIGVIGVSLAAIWVRLAVDVAAPTNKVGFSLFIAATRMIFSAIVLLPTWKNFKFTRTNVSVYSYAITAGVCLAIHFATWITSLSYTSIAASTVLVTTNPIWVGLLSWWWYGEKLTLKASLGIGIALLGGIIIAIADSGGGGNYSNSIWGDALALIGAVMSSLYIIFGSQAQRRGLATKNYIAIAYSTAAICLLPLPLGAGINYTGHSPQIYLYLGAMAITSQLIGHSSLNWAVRVVSPTLIGLSLLWEPVVASLLGAMVFDEIPSIELLLGGSIILLGMIIFLARDRS
ncbi:MAG: EamA family transporter [Cyanobacteria bacterium J06623_7]